MIGSAACWRERDRRPELAGYSGDQRDQPSGHDVDQQLSSLSAALEEEEDGNEAVAGSRDGRVEENCRAYN